MKGEITEGIMQCLRENPGASIEELAEYTGAKEKTIKDLLLRYRKNGDIENVGTDGEICYIVHREPKEVKTNYKKAMLTQMCDAYFDDFLRAEMYSERVEIGKMICRILEKL